MICRCLESAEFKSASEKGQVHKYSNDDIVFNWGTCCHNINVTLVSLLKHKTDVIMFSWITKTTAVKGPGQTNPAFHQAAYSISAL